MIQQCEELIVVALKGPNLPTLELKPVHGQTQEGMQTGCLNILQMHPGKPAAKRIIFLKYA
jgi:hypothetical protein